MIAGDPALGRAGKITRAHWIRAGLVALLFALTLGFSLAFQPLQESVRLEVGKVSPRTILAPDRITFVSQIQSDDARAKAEAQVKDIYDPPDAELARERVRLTRRVFDYLDSLRHDPYSNPEQKLDWARAIPSPSLSTPLLSRTLALEESVFHRVETEALYVVDVTMRDEIRPGDLTTALARLPSRVSLALPAEEAEIVVQWARAFIAPNSFLNPLKTGEQRAIARERVGSVYRTIEKGEAVVREGEVVSPLALEALEALGILRPRATLTDYVAPILFAVLITLFFALYILRFRRALLAYSRALLLVAVVIVAFTVGAKYLVAERAILPYLYPLGAAALLVAVLIDSETALGVAVALALCTSFVARLSVELGAYALLSGAVAAMSLRRIERLQQFLRSGAYLAMVNVGSIAVFQFSAAQTDWTVWGQMLIAALGNGALSGLLALGSVFVLGRIFGITTSLDLLDLARPTHPLLQKLLRDAPGTYHHSLIVSQLAEQAAHAIDADALLLRVGAYYHDVGKMSNPHAFIENQLDGVNVHDALEPRASAGIVIDHVAAGQKFAKQYGLPQRLRELIPEHHGTTHAAYFFRKAASNGQVNENDFRYPGPKPQTREAAILMLADGIEATTRAERPTTPEQIRAIIERIVGERVRDGQLSDCDLTLRDLRQIQDAFFGVLQGLFHSRIKYPEARGTDVIRNS